MRTIRKYSPPPPHPPRTLVGNLISDYSRFITSFVIAARKHLFCPRLCQEGKQISRTTDEYSNVSSLPVRLSRCKSLSEKFLVPCCQPPEAAKAHLCIFYLSVNRFLEVPLLSAGIQRNKAVPDTVTVFSFKFEP